MTRSQLSLDGGQSGIRTLLTTDGTTRPGPEFSGILSHRPLLDQLAEFVLAALEGLRVDVVAAGVSGLGPGDSAAALAEHLDGAAGTVLVAHDSTTSYLGALGVAQGAVVASGTGAVTLAVGPERVLRVDGWGHLLGDLGSGFWIGREALMAVLAAFDGRGPATALTAAAEREFGDLARLYLEIQGDTGRVKRVAAWARTVAELAPTDEVSRDISLRAGRHLAASVASGLRAVGAEPRVSRLGNVFRNPLVETAFREALAEHVPGVEVVEPAGSGLDGAARLAEVPADSPLGALVHRA
ncbi:BadF/BadG/BcrA/BcrD ATPase family protein [Tessaracoccus terricola]